MASPCGGLGFHTTWWPQSIPIPAWCLRAPKVTITREPGGNCVAFYDQVWELAWYGFNCGQKYSQMGGVSKSPCKEHKDRICCGHLPQLFSLPYRSTEYIFLTSSLAPNTFLSGSLLLFTTEALPESKRLKWNHPPSPLEAEDSGVLSVLFPLTSPSGSENHLILNSRGLENS